MRRRELLRESDIGYIEDHVCHTPYEEEQDCQFESRCQGEGYEDDPINCETTKDQSTLGKATESRREKHPTKNRTDRDRSLRDAEERSPKLRVAAGEPPENQ